MENTAPKQENHQLNKNKLKKTDHNPAYSRSSCSVSVFVALAAATLARRNGEHAPPRPAHLRTSSTPSPPIRTMLLQLLTARLRLLLLLLLAIVNRALCCFSRKRRNSFGDCEVVLQSVSIGGEPSAGTFGATSRKRDDVSERR